MFARARVFAGGMVVMVALAFGASVGRAQDPSAAPGAAATNTATTIASRPGPAIIWRTIVAPVPAILGPFPQIT